MYLIIELVNYKQHIAFATTCRFVSNELPFCPILSNLNHSYFEKYTLLTYYWCRLCLMFF